MKLDLRRFAEIGFSAYRVFTKGKSLVTGNPIPHFEELPELTKDAWKTVAQHIIESLEDIQDFNPLIEVKCISVTHYQNFSSAIFETNDSQFNLQFKPSRTFEPGKTYLFNIKEKN